MISTKNPFPINLPKRPLTNPSINPNPMAKATLIASSQATAKSRLSIKQKTILTNKKSLSMHKINWKPIASTVEKAVKKWVQKIIE